MENKYTFIHESEGRKVVVEATTQTLTEIHEAFCDFLKAVSFPESTLNRFYGDDE